MTNMFHGEIFVFFTINVIQLWKILMCDPGFIKVAYDLILDIHSPFYQQRLAKAASELENE